MLKRTAILIRCSDQEAELIRRSAKSERRTISGFVLSAVMSRIEYRTRLQANLQQRKPGDLERDRPQDEGEKL